MGNARIIALGLCATCYTLKRQDEEHFGGLREAVLERDGYRCRVCDTSGRDKRSITVHHRVPGKSGMSLMLSLCPGCQAKVHRRELYSPDAAIAAEVATASFAKSSPALIADRPELNRLRHQLREGDIVPVSKLDRLARSTRNLLEIVEVIGLAGARFSLFLSLGHYHPTRQNDHDHLRRHRRVRVRLDE